MAFLIRILIILNLSLLILATTKPNDKPHPLTDNWAVLVSTSKYWYNYRHAANVLSIYRSIKRLGIDDSRIVLMLADDMACNARNIWPGTVLLGMNERSRINLYGEDTEVDYRGEEVTVENFLRLLTGRHEDGTPRSKKLLTSEGSNILIYVTGHGGDGFIKFQDKTELTSIELADAFEQMHQKRRYNEILLIVDSCQSESMSSNLYSPNIIGIGSSEIGEDSLAHLGDRDIGVLVVDKYTYYALQFLEGLNFTTASKTPLNKFFRICPKQLCSSTVKVRLDLYKRDPSRVPVIDFFGNEPHYSGIKVEDEPTWANMLYN